MPTIADLADPLRSLRPRAGLHVIGLTGGVACGKSTLAATLVAALSASPDRPRVDCVGTDGFLYPNATLTEMGLLDRKGFPETYDKEAMAAAIAGLRGGQTLFPGYSHLLYDIDPGLGRRLERPDILILEGLGLGADAPVDTLVYLDASRQNQEAWYVSRFLDLWRKGRDDSRSFYARFRDLDQDGVARLASMVWTKVNLVNLEAHIEPVRDVADVVVRKADHHAIEAVDVRPCALRARPQTSEATG